MNTLKNITLNDYDKHRSSMIYALMSYSYYKPAKLNKFSAEDIFQDGFFKFKELLALKKLEFNDSKFEESFIWRINKWTYLSHISTDKSKYNRGIPYFAYIEDIKGLTVTDIIDEEYEELEEVNLDEMAKSLLSNISNKDHKKYYKMYLYGSSMKKIAEKYSLNVRSLEQQINRINKNLEKQTGFKISKRKRL